MEWSSKVKSKTFCVKIFFLCSGIKKREGEKKVEGVEGTVKLVLRAYCVVDLHESRESLNSQRSRQKEREK